jgi:MoaA/NifB/PqqE/SkfB family radical SAM enzyme
VLCLRPSQEVITHLEGALSASHASLGRVWQEVVFAGWGEPTLRWETVCDVAEEIRRKHKNVKVCTCVDLLI